MEHLLFRGRENQHLGYLFQPPPKTLNQSLNFFQILGK